MFTCESKSEYMTLVGNNSKFIRAHLLLQCVTICARIQTQSKNIIKQKKHRTNLATIDFGKIGKDAYEPLVKRHAAHCFALKWMCLKTKKRKIVVASWVKIIILNYI